MTRPGQVPPYLIASLPENYRRQPLMKNAAFLEFRAAASKRGKLEVPWRASGKWLWVPPLFGEGWDIDRWVRMLADAVWEKAYKELPHTPAHVNLLEAQLRSLHGLYGQGPWLDIYVYLPDPRLLPFPVGTGAWRPSAGRDEALRTYTLADDPEHVCAQPPVVEEFHTGNLGTGLKVLRYEPPGDSQPGEVMANLHYAWRCEEHQTDVTLMTATDELTRLQRASADVDELARSMKVVPR